MYLLPRRTKQNYYYIHHPTELVYLNYDEYSKTIHYDLLPVTMNAGFKHKDKRKVYKTDKKPYLKIDNFDLYNELKDYFLTVCNDYIVILTYKDSDEINITGYEIISYNDPYFTPVVTKNIDHSSVRLVYNALEYKTDKKTSVQIGLNFNTYTFSRHAYKYNLDDMDTVISLKLLLTDEELKELKSITIVLRYGYDYNKDIVDEFISDLENVIQRK